MKNRFVSFQLSIVLSLRLYAAAYAHPKFEKSNLVIARVYSTWVTIDFWIDLASLP